MQWIMSHAALLSGFSVAVLDFVFGINPNLEANGLLHAIYLWLKGSPPKA